jgi:hypothetical protein
MKIKIIYYLILLGIFIGSLFLFFSRCTKPDENIVYSSDNPDPYPANFNVAVLDSIQPISDYPTNVITIIGAGFDTRKPEYNFVWFDIARARVINMWAESLHV